VSLLEKQMKAKLERKIQENQRLREKRQIMQEIEQHREESLRLHEVESSRKKMESSLLHESNVANVKMIRKSRTRSQRQFMNEQKSRSDESALSLHFKEIQMSKSKLEHR
jgi:nicotinamide mononucleotide adenylyltransferase